MVFSSAPVYLDPPNCNWNQFQANLQAPSVTSGIESHQLSTPPALAAAPQAESGTPGSIRPGSMSERARMAKIPLPEAGLNCPRCESTNTKFCYFNNYSLTQPRHFCKTCRRYWTRGGALRNVPVGGGCRCNKRRKSSASSSKSASSAQTSCQDGTSSTSSTATEGGIRSTVLSSLFAPQSQLQLMASLHGLSDCPGAASSLGLGFPGMQSLEAAADYQLGTGISGMGLEHWRMPQIQELPFLGRVEAPPTTAAQPVQGLYQFEDQAEGEGIFSGAAGLPKVTSAALITQMASVKMEDAARLQGAHSSRKYLGMSIDERYWGSTGGGDAAGARVSGANSGSGSCAGWATDLSGINSTSSGNIL